MTTEDISRLPNRKLFEKLGALQAEFDSSSNPWRMLKIIAEHVAIVRELRSRGLSQYDIEVGKATKQD